MNSNAVTAIIVNRKTLKLTERCLMTLFDCYPHLEVILVDNRSDGDPSRQYVLDIAGALPNVRACMITSGVPEHGRGLATGIKYVKTPYFLTLDSDVTTLRGGWIEAMLSAFERDPLLFAIGHLCLNTNKNCLAAPKKGEKTYHFVHPFCAMWDRIKYKTVSPFDTSGQPVCRACITAEQKGYHLANLEGIHPHNESTALYVSHVWGGTRTILSILEDEERRKGLKK